MAADKFRSQCEFKDIKESAVFCPFLASYAHFIDGVIPDVGVRVARSQNHTAAVANLLAVNSPNPLLGLPLPVHESEKTLPRQCRSILTHKISSPCSQLLRLNVLVLLFSDINGIETCLLT